MIKKIAILITILLLVSCSSKKSVIQTTKKRTSKTTSINRNSSERIEASPSVKVTNELIFNYINTFSPVAQSNMKTYGIPASIILAQGLLESGYGAATLCVKANNHFGIKCHSDWTGDSVSYDDDALGECFRKYKDPFDSFRDHALFLTSGARYSPLFKLDRKDYKAWANGLKNAGYATDSSYPTKLISLIERYQLYKYDDVDYVSDTYAAITNVRSSSNNGDYLVQQGDTLYSISKKFNLSVDELKQKNNFVDNSISIGQKIRVK